MENQKILHEILARLDEQKDFQVEVRNEFNKISNNQKQFQNQVKSQFQDVKNEFEEVRSEIKEVKTEQDTMFELLIKVSETVSAPLDNIDALSKRV